nr:DNA-directed DNA polymerase [Tanacetum cinerariifolium]
MEEDYKPTVQHQRRVNPKIHDVIKKEVEKLLDAGLIYPISDSPWVSPVHYVPKKGRFTVVKNEENELIPTHLVTGWRVCIDYEKLNEATRKDHFPLLFMDQMLERLAGNEYYCFLDGFFGLWEFFRNLSLVHCVPKKGGFTVVENEENELIPTRLVTGWRVCIDYHKLNEATRKDDFPLPFMDQMLERLAGNEYYCFLDGFSRYFQIPIDPHDQEKTTFTCPYGTFAYRRMPFGLCNAPGTFQRYTNLSLNWEKSHFIVKEGIVLGHKISKNRIEVDRAKVDVIAKLPHPTTVKGIRNFLDHAGFYRRFIQDFSKISRPMTHLLEKNTPFVFSEDCIQAFQTLKKKLTKAPILIAPNWDLPFELMCDASDFAIGAVLGQRHEKHFKPIHYASKIMNDAENNYTTIEKEMLEVVMLRQDCSDGFCCSKSLISRLCKLPRGKFHRQGYDFPTEK